MDAVLFGLLAEGVQNYLRGVLGPVVPDRGREPSGAAGSPARAGAEACRLAAAWRALLRQHELGADGHCVTCGRGRRWTTWARRAGRVRSARWWGWVPVRARPPGELCTVWQVAVAYVIRRLPGGRREAFRGPERPVAASAGRFRSRGLAGAGRGVLGRFRRGDSNVLACSGFRGRFGAVRSCGSGAAESSHQPGKAKCGTGKRDEPRCGVAPGREIVFPGSPIGLRSRRWGGRIR